MLFALPVQAGEAVLTVHQAQTLAWDWFPADESGPVQEFIVRCGNYLKVMQGEARSMTIGQLFDTPGLYDHCTVAARNQAGESAKAVLPPLLYQYSYRPIILLWTEALLWLGACVGALSTILPRLRTRLMRQTTQALPEPMIILDAEKVGEHARTT